MKKRTIFRNMCLLFIAFIAIFSIDMKVEAAKLCTYSLDYTYSKQDWFVMKDVSDTLNFSLLQAGTRDGYDYYSIRSDTVSISDQVTIEKNWGGYVYYPSSDGCPDVTVYQRYRWVSPVYSKEKSQKFYIQGENPHGTPEFPFDEFPEKKGSEWRQLCSEARAQGKDSIPAEGVSTGKYMCDNFSSISGTLEKSQCSDDERAQIEKAIEDSYKNWYGRFEALMSDLNTISIQGGSGFTDIGAVESYCNDRFNKEYDGKKKSLSLFSASDVISNKTAEFSCNLEADSLGEDYVTRSQDAFDGLDSIRSQKVTQCIQNTKLSEEEKKVLDDKNKDESEKNRDENQQDADQQKTELRDLYSSFGWSDATISCEGLLGQKLLDVIQKLFNYVKIAAPILLLVLGSVDFGQAVLMDDRDALRKAGSRFIKRAIACVAIFFAPYIIMYILKFIDSTGVDPNCLPK